MQAGDCSIKEISKENFNGLKRLLILNLQYNQIESIDDDTFEYIPAVEEISLSFNMIKKLNGLAFATLDKLSDVFLFGNECINEDFDGAERIANMPRIVTLKCGFDEPTGLGSGLGRESSQVEGHGEALQICGVPKKATGLIFGGENFDRGDFPWMVALYHKTSRKRKTEYICGGSIISNRHVLTAAHCLDDPELQYITAVFGAYDLEDSSEVEKFAQSTSIIFLHDNWSNDPNQFYADIAILLMPEEIEFSIFVQPICLWEQQDELKTSHGVVAGWGSSEAKVHETVPTKVILSIGASEECNPVEFTFCAGIADGRGACSGDSGSGFVVYDGDAYYLKGIVSTAVDGIFCNHNHFTVFTDVMKFKLWIDTTMRRSLK